MKVELIVMQIRDEKGNVTYSELVINGNQYSDTLTEEQAEKTIAIFQLSKSEGQTVKMVNRTIEIYK